MRPVAASARSESRAPRAGNDNDNANGVDDCGEDPFAPTISSEAAVVAALGKWFKSETAATDFVRGGTGIDDDCRIVKVGECECLAS